MRNKYFNVEVRVDTLSELNLIEGSNGKRVLVIENGKYYYWDSINQVWAVESTGVVNYSYYTCQIIQNGTSPAYDNVLGTPTLGGFINWQRVDVGVYLGTLEGGFPANRTMFIYNSIGNGEFKKPVSMTFRTVQRVDDSTIVVLQVLSSDQSPADGVENMDLEIRVYDSNIYRD